MRLPIPLLALLISPVLAASQSSMLSNGSFEGLLNQGLYPRRNERFAQHPCPGWLDYRNGIQSAWFYDSLWVQPNINVIDPEFQNAFFRDSLCQNHASVFDRFYTQQLDSLDLMRAHSGRYFVGIDASAGIDDGAEGVQQVLSGCPLNSGTYQFQVYAARAFKGGTVWRDQEVRVHLSTSMGQRDWLIDDWTLPANDPCGQWQLLSKTFQLSATDPDHQDLDWIVISGRTAIDNTECGGYVFLDDASLFRPCDQLLVCSRTHGQICAAVARPAPPGNPIRVIGLENASSLRIRVFSGNSSTVLDSTYYNPNGIGSYYLSRFSAALPWAAAAYEYEITASNPCGAQVFTGTIWLSDTSSYTPSLPWVDSAANWSPMPIPIPCCLDSLTLSNITIRGDVSYIVRNQITVQSGVSIAPNSHVTLQAGNVIEIAQAEFGGSNSTLEILEIPCPQRQAQGQECGGGHATITSSGYTASAITVDSAKAAVNPEGPNTIQSTALSVDSAKAAVNAQGNNTIHSPKITISPNPARESAAILIHLPAATTATLTLLDLQNRPLRQILTNQSIPAGHHRQTVQLQDLPPGIYLLELRTPEAITHTRLVKQ